MSSDETICAVSTAPGGALGIIRISGPESFSCLEGIFVSNGKKTIAETKPYSLIFGHIMDHDEILDEVLVSVFRSPHSYTGEDSIEISCHGSGYILRRALELLIENGCRMARPGEFTQRAFLNGKMDLSQAEAVADLIASSTAAASRMAMSQMRGDFSKELSFLRDKLLKLTSLLELELDFSEEDVQFASRVEILMLSKEIKEKIHSLSKSFHTGNCLKNGIPIAIVGPTNAGKSTLLNCLVKDDRSIVSDIHGTTRDTIEDTVVIKGILYRIIDTAGIRKTDDKIESLGIERTYKAMDNAEIIICLESPDTCLESDTLYTSLCRRYPEKNIISVLNKSDLMPCPSKPDNHISLEISALSRQGIENLEETIFKISSKGISKESVIVSNARHYEALVNAESSLDRAIENISKNLSGDLIVEDIRQCLFHLAEIIGGQITSDEVLGNIFKNFCIGK